MLREPGRSHPMADVHVVVPAPAVRVSRLAVAAADAVVCLWIASVWFLLAGGAAALVGSLACGGWECPAAGAAWTAFRVSLLVAAVVCPLAALLLSKFVGLFYINQLEKGAAALEPPSDTVLNAHITAAVAFACIQAFGLLLELLASATKDPATARIAYVVMALPSLGISVMCCLVSIPGLAVRVWRMRRHSSASVVPISTSDQDKALEEKKEL